MSEPTDHNEEDAPRAQTERSGDGAGSGRRKTRVGAAGARIPKIALIALGIFLSLVVAFVVSYAHWFVTSFAMDCDLIFGRGGNSQLASILLQRDLQTALSSACWGLIPCVIGVGIALDVSAGRKSNRFKLIDPWFAALVSCLIYRALFSAYYAIRFFRPFDLFDWVRSDFLYGIHFEIVRILVCLYVLQRLRLIASPSNSLCALLAAGFSSAMILTLCAFVYACFQVCFGDPDFMKELWPFLGSAGLVSWTGNSHTLSFGSLRVLTFMFVAYFNWGLIGSVGPVIFLTKHEESISRYSKAVGFCLLVSMVAAIVATYREHLYFHSDPVFYLRYLVPCLIGAFASLVLLYSVERQKSVLQVVSNPKAFIDEVFMESKVYALGIGILRASLITIVASNVPTFLNLFAQILDCIQRPTSSFYFFRGLEEVLAAGVLTFTGGLTGAAFLLIRGEQIRPTRKSLIYASILSFVIVPFICIYGRSGFRFLPLTDFRQVSNLIGVGLAGVVGTILTYFSIISSPHMVIWCKLLGAAGIVSGLTCFAFYTTVWGPGMSAFLSSFLSCSEACLEGILGALVTLLLLRSRGTTSNRQGGAFVLISGALVSFIVFLVVLFVPNFYFAISEWSLRSQAYSLLFLLPFLFATLGGYFIVVILNEQNIARLLKITPFDVQNVRASS